MIAILSKQRKTTHCIGCTSFIKDKTKYGGNCKSTPGKLRITRYKQAGVPAWCPKGKGI